MLGKPRGKEIQLPAVNFRNQSESISFDITAYPVPVVKFAFLGASRNSTAPETPVQGIKLSGSCQQRGSKPYISTCNITVENVTSSAAAGFYQVNVSNSFGVAKFFMEVKYNGMFAWEPSNTNALSHIMCFVNFVRRQVSNRDR